MIFSFSSYLWFHPPVLSKKCIHAEEIYLDIGRSFIGFRSDQMEFGGIAIYWVVVVAVVAVVVVVVVVAVVIVVVVVVVVVVFALMLLMILIFIKSESCISLVVAPRRNVPGV